MRRGGPFMLVCSRHIWWLCYLDQAGHLFTKNGIHRICERHDRALIALSDEDKKQPPSSTVIPAMFWIGNTAATNSTIHVKWAK